MTKFTVIEKKPSKNVNLSQKALFLTPPRGSKRDENEFSGKKVKRHDSDSDSYFCWPLHIIVEKYPLTTLGVKKVRR